MIPALEEALDIIHVWHGEVGWDIYLRSSPEMKRLTQALVVAREAYADDQAAISKGAKK